MAAYKITSNGYIRATDGAFIPSDPANADYRAVQAWIAAGNTPDPQYTTAELRLKRKADAYALYDQKIAAGFNYTQASVTKNFQIDASSQLDITAKGAQAKFVLQNLGVWNSNFAWRATDNSFMPMTAAQMSAFADAVSAYIEAMDQTVWNHADNLTNPAYPTYVADASVATYDITTGWPAN